MKSPLNLPQKDLLRHGWIRLVIMLGVLPFLPISSSAQAGSCVPPPSGLVSWWQAEGNANDSFGTNNGLFVGGPSFGTGEVGDAFNLNGSSQYIDVPNSAALTATTNLTVEAWIYPRGLNPASASPIVKKSGEGLAQQDGYSLEMNDTGGVAIWGYVSGGIGWVSSVPATVPLNQWSHVAGVYDGTNLFIYLNGVLVGAPVHEPGQILASGNDLQIGHDPAIPARYFNGLIDEASVYNTALSAAQIQAIYNAGSAGKCAVAPVITSQPSNETVFEGNTVSFSVNASGGQPSGYQWKENSTNIPVSVNPTATNATLVLTNVQPAQSGNLYSVVVTNIYGSTNSSNALLTVLGPGSCFTPPAGLVDWWPGEHSGLDITGTNNGTLIGGLNFAPGEVGQAFKFNGTSAYVSIPASASLDVGQGPGLTIEAWIKPADALSMRPLTEWNNGSGGYGVHFWINQPVPFGSGPGSLYANVVDATGQGHSIVSPPGLIVTNMFQHVALTYDRASGVATFYYNGAMVAQQYIGSFALKTSYPFYLGYRPSGAAAGTLFTGEMDEVSLYNNALSAVQIQTIYAVGSGGKCKLPVIASQPQSQVDYYGTSIVLSVNAGGSGTLSYQWLDNGAVITNATNATLMLNNLQFANAGAYSVVISNMYGVTTSAPAFLTVNPAGVSIALYSGITITGVPGLTYGIQYSTDLSNTNAWLGLTNVTLTDTNALSFDLQPATLSRRYYRVVLGPISIP